jgi:dephospho-CoA kinase
MMRALGLTGSIATGKSTVLKMFADAGAAIFSADAAVHTLYAGSAVSAVESLFPGVAPEGFVDRTRLSTALAAEPHRLAELEALVHPMVRQEIRRFLDASRAEGKSLAVVEVPLLFETGHDYGFDATIVVACEDAIRRERALARPGMTVEKLESILERQMPQADKIRRADHVIDTSGTLDATRDAVRALVARLQQQGQQQ